MALGLWLAAAACFAQGPAPAGRIELEQREQGARLEAEQRAYRESLGELRPARRLELQRRLDAQRRELRQLQRRQADMARARQHQRQLSPPPGLAPAPPAVPEYRRQQQQLRRQQRMLRGNWPYPAGP